MKALVTVSVLLSAISVSVATAAETLSSGEYFVSQSWSQESDFDRLYLVHVPEGDTEKQYPLLLFLHGNGGNARGAMQGFLRRHTTLAKKYILVFPDGYLKSWNIVSERSKANDLRFIEAIIDKLTKYGNVKSNEVSIMGSSNGAALVNQLAIESRSSKIRNYISCVSPLNGFQHDGKSFKARGEDNSYDAIADPMKGKRLMNVSGTEDRLVPYRGGPSRVIPAKGGKLGFVDAEQSTFLWAKHLGHEGEKLSSPTSKQGNLEIFSYLDGDVLHIKVVGEGHGASRAIDERMLLDFLEGASSSP